jgi:hypothetical protein
MNALFNSTEIAAHPEAWSTGLFHGVLLSLIVQTFLAPGLYALYKAIARRV